MTIAMPHVAPHNIEAEQALLGSILWNNQVYGVVSAELESTHFFEPLHAEIYHQIGKLISSGQNASPVTLKDVFPNVEIMRGMPVSNYLARLLSEGKNTAGEIQTFIGRVRDLAQMRGILDISQKLAGSGADGVFPDSALTEAWSGLDEVRNAIRRDAGHRGPIGEFAKTLLEVDTSHVVTTGLKDLDHSIAGGWRAGRLYILAGRPGMGKTVLGTATARRVARRGYGVSLYSLELDTREVAARLAADEMAHHARPVPYRDIVAGLLDEQARAQTEQAIERLSGLPLLVDATGGLAINEIEARLRIDRDKFVRSGRKLSVVVIDYLGLIRAADRYRGQRVLEVGEIALAGKTIAKRLDCAVVMLAQLNRSVESRDDKRPTMSDLRDSGNIEEHADFVGLLYRPFYYTERSPQWRNQDPEAVARGLAERFSLELIIGKNRLGSTGVVDLWCDPALSAVADKDRYR